VDAELVERRFGSREDLGRCLGAARNHEDAGENRKIRSALNGIGELSEDAGALAEERYGLPGAALLDCELCELAQRLPLKVDVSDRARSADDLLLQRVGALAVA
jgi:hypothetical protein